MALSKRRSRSENGGGSRIFSVGPALPKTLKNAYLAERASEAAAKRERKAEPPKHKGKMCNIPEPTLRQIRALREFYAWSHKQLAAFFSLPKWRIQQVCYYHVASDVTPAKEDAPIGAVPPDIPDKRGRPRTLKPAVPPMQGTLRSLEEVRARRAADEAQAAAIEAELRLNDD